MNMEELMEKARAAAEFSYSPYSKFRVGAALLCKNGEVITGTNIENRSFGLTVCAERNALGTALGKGITEFEALAVSCPDADYAVSPCGACRQVISEFTTDDFPISFQGDKGEVVNRTMSELFPDNALNELKD
ncbi:MULTISPECIES: cytidine deaminase [unclassified Oceanispirochaeta]|nr:cytidine deaminase [Oceanispirochaeta sp. M2]NPD72587.1 cytidine deaminase [Oceanispirochaeta sp. M1]RDG31739.1 cytidine deaminase [Oceanispirochaeta sp. M1]